MAFVIEWPADISQTDAEKEEFRPIFATNAMWNEFLLFQRLIYKMNNQHRPCQYFKWMQEIQRYMRHLSRLERWLERHHVENRGSLHFVATLNTCKKLIEFILFRSKRLAVFVKGAVEKAYFLNTMQVIYGCLCRMTVLLRELSDEIDAQFAESVRKRTFAMSEMEAKGLPKPSQTAPTPRKQLPMRKRTSKNDGEDDSKEKAPIILPKKHKTEVKEEKSVTHADIDDIFDGFI